MFDGDCFAFNLSAPDFEDDSGSLDEELLSVIAGEDSNEEDKCICSMSDSAVARSRNTLNSSAAIEIPKRVSNDGFSDMMAKEDTPKQQPIASSLSNPDLMCSSTLREGSSAFEALLLDQSNLQTAPESEVSEGETQQRNESSLMSHEGELPKRHNSIGYEFFHHD